MADPLSDPLFIGLLALSSIASVVIILYSMRRDRPPRPGRLSPPTAFSPAYLQPPPPAPWPGTPAQPPAAEGQEAEAPQEDRFAWVRDARRFLIDLRHSVGLPADQRCGYCGAQLLAPGALGYRAIHYAGGARREIFCRRCGTPLWRHSPQPAASGDELRQEVQALAEGNHPGVQISLSRPQPPRQAEPGRQEKPPAQDQQAAPEAREEAKGVASTDEKLRSLSSRQLLHLLLTCGGCIHYNADSAMGCTALSFSKRNFKVKRTHRICSWWSQQRMLAMALTGRLDVNTRYIDADYPSGEDKDILDVGGQEP